jgi:glycosyltransferase involved in cell wall biosynthesis
VDARTPPPRSLADYLNAFPSSYWFLDDARVFGGGQREVLALAQFVARCRSAVAVVACPEASELAERCRSVDIRVVDARFPDLGLRGARRIVRAVRDLRRLLAKLDTEAVIVGASLRTQVYAHAALAGRREHARIVHFMPEQDSAARMSARALLRRYGAVVVVGDNAARAYAEHLEGIHVHGVNNFLAPQVLEMAPRTPRPPLDGRAPTIGAMARLIPEKGVLELIEELALEPRVWTTLVVGGDRQDEQYVRALERRIAELRLRDRVSLLGPVEAHDEFFSQIDVLVVPSTGKEGQPTVIVEALAHGRPCIVREPLWSAAFDGLPVLPYRSADTLGKLLEGLESTEVSRDELVSRFSPKQALEAIEAAAAEAAGTS